MNRDPIPQDEVAAYHEAGHAVAAWAYGIEVKWISLNSAGPGMMKTHLATIADTCDLKRPKLRGTTDMIERHVVVRLAGPVGWRTNWRRFR